VWVGGEYSPETSNNAVLPLLAHFDGIMWSGVPTPGNGLQSSVSGLYQSSAGTVSVGTALPALQYDQITFAAFSPVRIGVGPIAVAIPRKAETIFDRTRTVC